MTLSDIAAGLEVTAEQRDHGVAMVDDTDADLTERLASFAESLPCEPAAAATILETHATGRSVGESARSAGVAPVTAAKTLYLLGVEGVNPLGPTARRVVRDWLDAELSRADALALTGATETEFALATYVETHEPCAGARETVDGVLAPGGDASVAKRDLLAETMDDALDLR